MRLHKTIFQHPTVKKIIPFQKQNGTDFPIPFTKGIDRATAARQVDEHELKEEEIHIKKLDNLVDKSEKILLKICTVFPFDLFPNQLSIEPTQVNLLFREFFFDQNIHSVPMKNINEVEVQCSVFFASLSIVDNSYVKNTFAMDYLKKREAQLARRIIQGLLVATREGIDLSKFHAAELRYKAESLGRAQAVE